MTYDVLTANLAAEIEHHVGADGLWALPAL